MHGILESISSFQIKKKYLLPFDAKSRMTIFTLWVVHVSEMVALGKKDINTLEPKNYFPISMFVAINISTSKLIRIFVPLVVRICDMMNLCKKENI
jgi:hypothetical protein